MTGADDDRTEAGMGRRWAADGAFAAALVALVWAAYAPSQKHGPRADQWCYLVDTMAHHTVPDAVAGTYSYNRTRTHSPGDTDLFRPVLFALLATEKVLFEGDLWLFQTVGMVLHCAVCLLLLTLLRQVAALAPESPADPARGRPDVLPYALTAFFALNPATMELVIFAHLHGYLLFLVLLLAAVALLLRHLTGPRAGGLASPSLWAAWGLTLVSAFTYELGQLFAVLAGLFVAAAAYPRAGLAEAARAVALFALVPVAYQVVNAHDLEVHRGRYTPDEAPAAARERVFTRATLGHSARFALFTAVHPACPSVLQMTYVEGRIHLAETFWDGRWLRHCGPAVGASAVVLAVAAGCGLVGLRNLLRRGPRPPLLVVLLFGSLYAVYAAVTVLGRMNLRPDPHPTLVRNTYYAYFALLFLMLAGYAAWQGLGRGGPAGPARTWLLAGLLALTAVGAEKVRHVNQHIAVEMAPETRPVRAVNLFLKEHRGEPDLTVEIDYEASDPIPRMCGLPVTQIVFARVWSENPKYRLAIRGPRAVVLSGPREEATRGN